VLRTTHDFTEIDVQKGKPFKDFGQGFYLAKPAKIQGEE
jgi:hypothetical protein